MLTLSLEQCLKATNNGTFSTKDLYLKAPLSSDDMDYLCDYLSATPIKAIDLNIEVTTYNAELLMELCNVIGNKTDLVKLNFEIEKLTYKPYFKNSRYFKILGFIDDFLINKINDKIIDALIGMVKNKPKLRELHVNLSALDMLVDEDRVVQFSKKIRKSPLTSLSLNWEIEQGSKFPLLSSKNANCTLSEFKLKNCSNGADVLNYLEYTTGLKTLTLDGLLIKYSDCDKLKYILRSNKNLEVLSLAKSNLGQLDSTLVLDTLNRVTNLKFLDLTECNLSRYNIDALCNYLTDKACTLSELNITKNDFMSTDAIKIASALLKNTSIHKITIDQNLIEDEGLQTIIKMLKSNQNITQLYMSKNCRYATSDETIKELCSLLSDPECKISELVFDQKTSGDQIELLTKAILANKSLVKVVLNYNLLDPKLIFCKFQIENHLSGIDNMELEQIKTIDFHLTDSTLMSTVTNSQDTFFSSQNNLISDSCIKNTNNTVNQFTENKLSM